MLHVLLLTLWNLLVCSYPILWLTLLKFTNNRISTFHEQFPELAQVAANRLIDLDELEAYFGILYLRAALKQNLWDSYSIWYHKSSCSIFPAAMSLNGFSFITVFFNLMTGLQEKNVKSTTNLLASETFSRKSRKTMLKLDIQAPT